METSYIVVGVLCLVIQLPVKAILRPMVIIELVHFPSNLLRSCHWVWVLFLWDCCQNLQLFFKSIHALFVFFLFAGPTESVHIGGFIGDYEEVLWVEIEVLVQDSAARLFFDGFFPLCVDLKRIEIRKFKVGENVYSPKKERK